jgi:dihydrofolate synthase/folylpolyglutamate synthase
MLRAMGLRTALYTSPHLIHFSERIQMDGVPVLDESIGLWTRQVLDAEKAIHVHLTGFELVTAVGLLALSASHPDVTVLEVGLGGRLDATNVVTPDITVLTPVGLDHTELLGDTVRLIAREKLGICRPGIPLVCAVQHPDVQEEVLSFSGSIGFPVIREGVDYRAVSSGSGFRYQGRVLDIEDCPLGLAGGFQTQNAGVALAALEFLAGDASLKEGCVREGLSQARWPGRFDLRRVFGALVLFDGGHNPPGILTLVQALAQHHPGRHPVLFASKKDKDAASVLAELSRVASRFIITTLPGADGHPPEELARMVSREIPCEVVHDPDEAMRWLTGASQGKLAICCGSLYLVGYYLGRLPPTG